MPADDKVITAMPEQSEPNYDISKYLRMIESEVDPEGEEDVSKPRDLKFSAARMHHFLRKSTSLRAEDESIRSQAKKCAECPKEIHPERIAAIPQTVTCSAKCSKARQLKHMRAGSKNSHGEEAATRY